MMALFLMSGSFMVAFLLLVIVFFVHTSNKRKADEELNRERFEKLSEQINETQKLFKTDVTKILSSFKNLLENK